LSKASQKAVALLAFILLKAFPARSAERPSPFAPLTRVLLPIVSLAGHDRECASACCQTRALAWSLSRLPAFPRFLPWVGPPIRDSLRCWVMGSPRGRWSVTGPPAPRFAPPRLSTGAQWVGLQGRIVRLRAGDLKPPKGLQAPPLAMSPFSPARPRESHGHSNGRYTFRTPSPRGSNLCRWFRNANHSLC
jgi:hypothetical protein